MPTIPVLTKPSGIMPWENYSIFNGTYSGGMQTSGQKELVQPDAFHPATTLTPHIDFFDGAGSVPLADKRPFYPVIPYSLENDSVNITLDYSSYIAIWDTLTPSERETWNGLYVLSNIDYSRMFYPMSGYFNFNTFHGYQLNLTYVVHYLYIVPLIYLYRASEDTVGVAFEATQEIMTWETGGFVVTPDYQFQIRLGLTGPDVDVPFTYGSPIDRNSGIYGIVDAGVAKKAHKLLYPVSGSVEIPFTQETLYARAIQNGVTFSYQKIPVAPIASLTYDVDVEEVVIDASDTLFLFSQPANNALGDYTFSGTRTNGLNQVSVNKAEPRALLDLGDIKYSQYSQAASVGVVVTGVSEDVNVIGYVGVPVKLQGNSSIDEIIGPQTLGIVGETNGAQIHRLSQSGSEGTKGPLLSNCLPASLCFRGNGASQYLALTFGVSLKKWVLWLFANPQASTYRMNINTPFDENYIGVRGCALFGDGFLVVGRKFATNEIWCAVSFDLQKQIWSEVRQIGTYQEDEPHALTCYQKTVSGSPQIVVTNCLKTYFHPNDFGKTWNAGLV